LYQGERRFYEAGAARLVWARCPRLLALVFHAWSHMAMKSGAAVALFAYAVVSCLT